MPDATVSTNRIDFGKLTPDMLPKSEILMIENIGKVLDGSLLHYNDQ
jgi:hypothetical protein